MVETMPASGVQALPATIRADFPLLRADPGRTALAYLDNAATTQKPQAVLDALVDYYVTANSNVGRGFYQLSRSSTERYEDAREVVQRFLNAARVDEVVFTRNTTDAINMLTDSWARDLVEPGDQVVVTGMEHNSNMLPWRRLCERAGAEHVVVPVDDQGRVDLADFRAALTPRVRLVAVAHVSNVLGTVNPVREMADAAHRIGVPVVVDGAQAVPHRRVDVRGLGADFYCFSGHKAYGPMGIGVLYGRRELLEQLEPYQVGGGTVKGVRFDAPVEYVPAPARLEAGTPHVAGAVALGAALTYLDDMGMAAVQAHDRLLVHRAVEALSAIDRVHVVGEPTADPSGIVSFTVEGIHPYDVGGHLDAHGIAVRSGVHCANAFLDALGLLGTVRMSFAVYNTEEEVERVAAALRTVRPGPWTRDHPTERFV
jgi:SufS family cysteine desulfurase